MSDVSPSVAQNSAPASRSGAITAPYFDLDSSLKVAEMIHNNGGGVCTPDQLAHWLGYTSIRSGTYLTRVSAANKHFGLIDSQGDKLVLTERARKILAPVMPDDAQNSKVEAFLSVVLFSKIYEKFRGGQIPPESGLKNLFQNEYKIPADRASPTVRVFMSSSEQAGVLTQDRLRLIRPPSSNNSTPPKEEAQKPDINSQQERPKATLGGGGNDPPGGVHSAIIGLLRELPLPGTPWPPLKKKRFLEAFKATVDFIYPDPEENSP